MFCKRLNQRFKLVTRRLIWWLDWRYSDRNHVAKTRPVRYKLRSRKGKFYGFTNLKIRMLIYYKQTRPDMNIFYMRWFMLYTESPSNHYCKEIYSRMKKIFIFRHRKSWKHYLFFRSDWNRIEWNYNCLVLKIATDLNKISCKLLSPSLRSSLNF